MPTGGGGTVSALYVGIVVVGLYVFLRGLRDWRDNQRRARQASSFLAHHERDRRQRQLNREAWESEKIGWRR
jgi:hypothetical protein